MIPISSTICCKVTRQFRWLIKHSRPRHGKRELTENELVLEFAASSHWKGTIRCNVFHNSESQRAMFIRNDDVTFYGGRQRTGDTGAGHSFKNCVLLNIRVIE